MDSLDKFFKKYSYKFPKGYPDLNDEQDVNLLADLLENMGIKLQEKQQLSIDFPEDLDGEIKQLTSTLDDKDIKRKIIKILKKANKKEDIYDEDEVKGIKSNILKILKDEKKLASNYANAVYRISLDLGEYKKLNSYLENPTITTLPKNGNLEDLFIPTSLSKDFITELIELYGRSTGKGEVALITFLKNCTARGGKKEEDTSGDIKLNGNPIEVKQGSKFKLVPFDISEYGLKPSAYLEKETELKFESGERWTNTLQKYWEDKKVSTEQINQILKNLYNNYVPEITDQKILQTPNGLSIYIATNLAKKYMEKAKSIIFISASSPYNFKLINNFNEYENLIKSGNLKISAFSDKFPRFSYS